VPAFDFDATFGPDYLHFYRQFLTDDVDNAEAAEVTALLDLGPGMRVLDAPCGHGRIGNRLAAAGVEVVGVDRSDAFLAVARRDAHDRQVSGRFARGDLRRLPLSGPFDAALCWFTSFGYFEDDDNRRVLAEYRRVLRTGGRLLVESLHHDGFVRHFTSAPDATVTEAGNDLLVDATRFDPVTGRVVTRRTVVRNGTIHHSDHFIRLPTVPEWQAWLADAGFSSVEVSDRGGQALTLDSWRLVVVATA
jgi:ubiquinone/menaquinone biosynthesis C-methylase UbiE